MKNVSFAKKNLSANHHDLKFVRRIASVQLSDIMFFGPTL